MSASTELRAGGLDLLAATVGLMCGVPAYTPVSSLFFRTLEHEFSWSKTAAAISLIALPVTAVCLPFVGLLLDRFGVRRVAAVSVICLALSYGWLSMINGNLSNFYAAILALNVLGCATGPVAFTRVIATRFDKARGLALAIALLGISIGAMVLPPILAHVMAVNGWRAAYRLLALISLVGGMLAIALIRSPPPESNSAVAPFAFSSFARSKDFWLLSGAIFCISVASLGIVTQFQSLIIERGLFATQAVTLLSELAASVFVSRLLVGRSLDVLSPKWTAATVLLLAAAGCGLLLRQNVGFGYAAFAVALIGFSIGAELDLLSFFCARNFDLRHFSAIYGAISFFFYTGIAVGGIAYGALHDLTGTYAWPLFLSAVLLLLAAALFLMLPSPTRYGASLPSSETHT